MPNAPTPLVFDEISQYWAEMADEHETQAQVNFVKTNLAADGLVLDLNCGNGRHAVALRAAGYDVVGLDVSRRLLDLAKAKASDAKADLAFVRGDMQHLPFRNEVFAGEISLDSSFGYLPSEAKDSQSLSEVARTLQSRGVFLLDVFNGEYLRKRHEGFRVRNLFFGLARFPGFSGLFRWREYPSFFLLQKRQVSGGTLQDTWLLRDKKTGEVSAAIHVARLYTPERLHKLLDGSGLKTVKILGDYDGQEFNADSRRFIIVSRKS